MRVFVTGATGFIGRELISTLRHVGHDPIGFTRRQIEPSSQLRAGLTWHRADSLADVTSADLRGVDALVHLAAFVHQMGAEGNIDQAMYLAVNRDLTLLLAQAAKAAGVGHFVFISSIKALGESTGAHPRREDDEAAPCDAYGRSKLEAERGLMQLADGNFVVTIVRFPLVYGAGVKANFAQLFNAVRRGLPLPLGRANAPRSLLGLDNAVDAIRTCLERPRRTSRIYHVADAEAPSVRELIELIARSSGVRARLVDVPLWLLRAAARLMRRESALARLTEPLTVDTSRITSELGWVPPRSLEQGLRAMHQLPASRAEQP